MKRIRELGCDVSKYQYLWVQGNEFKGVIDFHKMKASGATFVIIKATDPFDVGGVDPCFARSWAGAKGILPRGAYHFFRPEISAVSQVKSFLAALNGDWGERAPVLDIEKNSKAISQTAFRSAIKYWLQEVEKATGMIPEIYTRQSFWDPQIGAWPTARLYRFFLAFYSTDLIPPIPLECHTIAYHQFSADGNMRGKEFGCLSNSIDLDYEWVLE